MIKHTVEKNFVCNICGKRLKRQSSLDLHLRQHTGTKNYMVSLFLSSQHQASNWLSLIFQCDACDATYFTASALRNHKVDIVCCNQIQISDIQVNKHMEVKETFLCTFCGKGFTKKANLESHITLHTGEKRYSCTQCDKKFRSHSVYQVTSLKDPYLTCNKKCLFPEPSSVPQGKEGVCVHLLWKGIHAKVSPSATHGHPHRREEPHMPSKI